jgi:hypothetical protein
LAFAGLATMPQPTMWFAIVSTALSAWGLLRTRSRATSRSREPMPITAFASPAERFQPEVLRPELAAS